MVPPTGATAAGSRRVAGACHRQRDLRNEDALGHQLDEPGRIARIVEQQFEIGNRILDAGLVPIIEPEVSINATDKAEAEDLLVARISEHLDGLGEGRRVMLKLTLPEQTNLFSGCIAHPNTVRGRGALRRLLA